MRRQVSARLSEESYTQLKALCAVLRVAQADVIARGFEALEKSLGASEQRLVAMLRRREPR